MNNQIKILDLINRLNHIAENEESIEMPGGYMEFNFTIGSNFIDLNCGKNLLVELYNDEVISTKEILEEIKDAIIDCLQDLQFAKDIVEFALKEEE